MDLVREPELPIVAGHRLFHSRAGELEHPTDVGRRDEVPGRAQHVRAQDRAVGDERFDLRVDDAGRALRDGPLRAGIVLRLYGTESLDDLERRVEGHADEPLPDESLIRDLRQLHRRMIDGRLKATFTFRSRLRWWPGAEGATLGSGRESR